MKDLTEIKKEAEAILFSVGKKISTEEIASLCSLPVKEIKKALNELKKDYASRETSLMVSEEGNSWNMVVKEKYMSVAQLINPHTELGKPTIETLAVIAWKAPVLQSDVIKARTGAAYEHIAELVDTGFITKNKHGRSYVLKLTQKFFEYFDLKDETEIKDRFSGFEEPEAKPEKKEDTEESMAELQIKDNDKAGHGTQEKPEPSETDDNIKLKEDTPEAIKAADQEKKSDKLPLHKDSKKQKPEENGGGRIVYLDEPDIFKEPVPDPSEEEISRPSKPVGDELLEQDNKEEPEPGKKSFMDYITFSSSLSGKSKKSREKEKKQSRASRNLRIPELPDSKGKKNDKRPEKSKNTAKKSKTRSKQPEKKLKKKLKKTKKPKK